MKIEYPAVIEWSQTDQVFEVSFPDLPGCVTYGENLERAEVMASDALTGYLQSLIDRSIPIPRPSSPVGARFVEPARPVSFSLWLRAKRKESGMTQTDVADKLGIKYQVYQKLEDPARTNPTLKTIAKLEKVFGETLVAI